MATTISVPVYETGAGSVPNDLVLLWEFKDYLDEMCARTDIARRFRPAGTGFQISSRSGFTRC